MKKTKKYLFANNKSKVGILNTKNAFTLIELLAIIVILAIIAVITVPIILNIIENSRKGAATDSAHGYKDAVNKWYVQELSKPNNENFNLKSQYTVSDGKLIDPTINNDEGILMPFSGDKPSLGELHYTNNTLQGGCLVFGDYQVIFDGGSVSSTAKGDCSEYDYVDPNVPTIPSCPGCKFIYATSSQLPSYGMMPESATDDYRTLIGTEGHTFFLGFIESTTISGKIGRFFACGVENGTPFCLEGYDTSKWSDNTNLTILSDIFENCTYTNTLAYCTGETVSAGASYDGYVVTYVGSDNCAVQKNGNKGCTTY